MKNRHLKLVKSEPAASEETCGWCAFIFLVLVTGILWWPIFNLFG
jgi:hypothetical protein